MAKHYRKKKHTIFKTFAILMALVLVVGATVAITLALMIKSTDTIPNTFVGNSGLDLEVEEKQWDDNGKEEAENYTPGAKINKDPKLVNTSKIELGTYDELNPTTAQTAMINNSSEYVAIKLEYQIFDASVKYTAESKDKDDNWETISYNKFKKLADINYISSAPSDPVNYTPGFHPDWIEKKGGDFDDDDKLGKTVFYYKKLLPPSTGASDTKNQTPNLFDQVAVLETLRADTIFECGNATHTNANSVTNNHFDGTTNLVTSIIGGTWGIDVEHTLENLIKKKADVNSVIYSDEVPYYYSATVGGEKTYIHAGLIPFRIKVTGYAVQANLDGSPMDLKIKDTTPDGSGKATYDSTPVIELNKMMGIGYTEQP